MRRLKIYFTSDVHGHIYPTENQGSLLQCMDDFEIDGNTLVMDGGDSIQGSPFMKFLDHGEYLGLFMGAVYDRGGYHYYTLGNHDFDPGFLVMKSFIEGMRAKCLCCNVVDTSGLLPMLPYEIRIMENGLKVGVTGAVTDFVNHWHSAERLHPFMVVDTFFALQQVNAYLKDRCDVTICIYHGGLELDLESGQVIDSSRENIGGRICRELDFDVLLTGHQHRIVEGQQYYGTYVVQPPAKAKGFAEILVEVEPGLKVCSGGVRTPSDGISEELIDMVMPFYDRSQEWLNRWVCTLDFPLESSDKITQAIEGTPFADLLHYVQLSATGADISVASLPNEHLSLPKGVSVADVMRTYPYANKLVVLEVTGQVILQALRRASSYFRWTEQGIVVDKRFLLPKEQHSSYDFFANVSYSVKLNPTGENLVSNVKVKGRPLVVERVYRVAMSDYRAAGMGGYDAYRDCPMVKIMEDDIQDMMVEFFRRGEFSAVPVYHDLTILDHNALAMTPLFP